RHEVLESGEVHAGSLDPRGDGAHDHHDEYEDAEGHEGEAGDLHGPVATGDLRSPRLPAADQVAGLAVGAEVGDLLDPAGVVVGDLGDVLADHAAHGAGAGLGEVGTGGGRGVHDADAIASVLDRGEHWQTVPDPYSAFSNHSASSNYE